jgi:hypothetical protein
MKIEGINLPSHRCHERIGGMMGLGVGAVRDANLLIDDPDRWLSEHGCMELIGLLKHDDGTKFTMDLVRRVLQNIRGDEGVLAADLHYTVDYIERWLDPEMAKWMIENISMNDLLPPNRYGFIHKYRREWSPTARGNFIPITAYCKICKGKMKPINTPFCSECHTYLLENVKEIMRITPKLITRMLAKKIVQREVCREVVEFVGRNFQTIVEIIIEDRRQRSLTSISV